MTGVTTQPAGVSERRARIGRRAVHDAGGAVVGYELLFRAAAGPDDDPDARDRASTEALRTAFGELGLQRFGARRDLYINATRRLVTGAEPMPFGAHNVVLEILPDIAVDAPLVDGLQALKQRGFRIAVDARAAGPEHARLLPLVDVVKLDIASAGDDLAALAAYVRSVLPHARLLADGIVDDADLEASRRLRIDLFTGPHFEPRAATGRTTIAPSQAVSLQLLAALSDADTTIEEMERIVAADPALSVRVLGTVNSASGTGTSVTSLRQAIVLLGRRSLSAWVMLAAMGGHPAGRREDMIDVLTRARVAESLGPRFAGTDAATGYAAGLLSGMVDVMEADAAHLARSARLDERLTAALVEGTGPVGALLTMLADFERTGAAPSPELAADLTTAYLHALGTAVATVDGILGPPETGPA